MKKFIEYQLIVTIVTLAVFGVALNLTADKRIAIKSATIAAWFVITVPFMIAVFEASMVAKLSVFVRMVAVLATAFGIMTVGGICATIIGHSESLIPAAFASALSTITAVWFVYILELNTDTPISNAKKILICLSMQYVVLFLPMLYFIIR